jgi:hypothetical protein
MPGKFDLHIVAPRYNNDDGKTDTIWVRDRYDLLFFSLSPRCLSTWTEYKVTHPYGKWWLPNAVWEKIQTKQVRNWDAGDDLTVTKRSLRSRAMSVVDFWEDEDHPYLSNQGVLMATT